jgi:hypothetical protein
MRNVILCLLAACDAGAPKLATPPPPAPPPVRADAALAAVVSDAPQWPPKELDALFAMSEVMTTADGAFVLERVADDTGARGDATLGFELHDRKDHLIGKRIMVLALDEAPDDPTRPARIAEAGSLIASHDFIAMTALSRAEVSDDGEHYAEHEQYGDSGTTVEWRNDRLAISVVGRPLVDRKVPASWYVPSYFDKGADLTCSNPPYLGGAYVGPASAKLVVVEVAYRGNDTCWEPGPKLHVVAL